MRPTFPSMFLLALICALWLIVSDACALTDDPPIAPSPPREPDVRLTPGAWLARLGGTSLLRNGADQSLDLQDHLNLRDLEPTFNAELDITRHDYFDLHLSGFAFSTESSGSFPGTGIFGDIQFQDGDPFRSSLDINSFSGEVRFAMYQPFNDSSQRLNSDGRRRIKFRFGPTIGARYYDIEQTVEHVGVARERTGGDWLAIQGGLHFELMFRPDQGWPWIDRFGLAAAGGGGPLLGGDGGSTWQVQSSFRVYFTNNVAFHFGYRMFEMNAENDDYEFKGGLQGLFVGGSIAF